MSKTDIRPTGAEGISTPANIQQAEQLGKTLLHFPQLMPSMRSIALLKLFGVPALFSVINEALATDREGFFCIPDLVGIGLDITDQEAETTGMGRHRQARGLRRCGMSEHYLTADTWSVDGQPELGEVRLASIHHIDRTIAAIHVIARMIGNSAYEPDAGNNAPLDPWAVQGLMAGVESLCHYVKLTTEGMLQQAARAAKPGRLRNGDPSPHQQTSSRRYRSERHPRDFATLPRFARCHHRRRVFLLLDTRWRTAGGVSPSSIHAHGRGQRPRSRSAASASGRHSMKTSTQALTSAESVADLLRRLTDDINQMRALFLAIEDRAIDEHGSALGIQFETLARIGSDIAERNAAITCDTMCALRDVSGAEPSNGVAYEHVPSLQGGRSGDAGPQQEPHPPGPHRRHRLRHG